MESFIQSILTYKIQRINPSSLEIFQRRYRLNRCSIKKPYGVFNQFFKFRRRKNVFRSVETKFHINEKTSK